MFPVNANKLTRSKAFSIHFGFTALILGALFVPIFFIWFPVPYAEAVGIQKLLLATIVVIVGVGPILTLVVFKPGKRHLQFDLVVIALMQSIALAFGIYSISEARPVFLAGLGHRFDLIQAKDVDSSNLPWTGPIVTGIRKASDPEQREAMLFNALSGKDYGHFPKYHAPLNEMRDELLQRAHPISDLIKINPEKKEYINKWLNEKKYRPDMVVFQGMQAQAKDMAVILNNKTAQVIGIIPLRPWVD
ncbi:hypothetical protein HNP33_000247 [Comamonas odontotermitis]|uniref:Type IV pilin accessory protein n=2 Tax=Comamonas odontotermitis TaxID=379895 RepID=A0ABR6RAM1_9BURK|nr:hypothetical protein [Comamonas odontotermitis]